MDQTVFEIPKMDCASEEQLIRMKLEAIPNVEHMEFDIPGRMLTVLHRGKTDIIENVITDLNLAGRRLRTDQLEEASYEKPADQRRLLWTVLMINFAFFAIEMTTGLISKSMGLVADSLDMLADAAVYGLSLFAVGGALARKKSIAKMAGYFQITLAIIGFVEVVRRFIGVEEVPDFATMIIVSVLALVANGICLLLLQKSKSKQAHMRASMIFTSNDIIINTGVIVAALLVKVLDSNKPDLIIGAIVFVIVVQGARRILQL